MEEQKELWWMVKCDLPEHCNGVLCSISDEANEPNTEHIALLIVLLYEVELGPILDWGRGLAAPITWYSKLVDFLEPC